MRGVFNYLVISGIFITMSLSCFVACALLDIGFITIAGNFHEVHRMLQEPEEDHQSFVCPECGTVYWIKKSLYGPYLSFGCRGCDYYGGIPPECDGWKFGPESPF